MQAPLDEDIKRLNLGVMSMLQQVFHLAAPIACHPVVREPEVSALPKMMNTTLMSVTSHTC